MLLFYFEILFIKPLCFNTLFVQNEHLKLLTKIMLLENTRKNAEKLLY